MGEGFVQAISNGMTEVIVPFICMFFISITF